MIAISVMPWWLPWVVGIVFLICAVVWYRQDDESEPDDIF